MDRYELRYSDFVLSEDQDAARDLFRTFYRAEVPTTRVRAAEPAGFDEVLWQQLVGLGVTSMGLPARVGGSGAGLVELALLAHEHGAALAPAPLVEHVVASRVLAAASTTPTELLDEAIGGTRILTVALQPIDENCVPQLVAAGSAASDIIAFDGAQLLLVSLPSPLASVPNQGSAPVGFWDPSVGHRTVLSSGDEAARMYALACSEWRLLTAAALVGLTERALALAVEFAQSRQTMGVAIGSLQGVAFPLVDVAIGVTGAWNLVLKAAWYCDHEPDERPDLVPAAFAYAARVTSHGTITAAHMQGGLGFTVEADASLYFLRAKGWSVLGGDPADQVAEVGDLLAACYRPDPDPRVGGHFISRPA
jgi:alkylation response protein AidB-like acyl-CoA dehydrogenase